MPCLHSVRYAARCSQFPVDHGILPIQAAHAAGVPASCPGLTSSSNPSPPAQGCDAHVVPRRDEATESVASTGSPRRREGGDSTSDV